jgi:AcrR family transcriptional regulator
MTDTRDESAPRAPSASQLLAADLGELGARERILRTALLLFNERGVHRVGTDLIIEQADVAKMTFYRLFKSKARLIAECLRIRDADWFALLRRHVDRHQDPEARALALFDAFEEWFQQPGFVGCPFIRSLYDFNLEQDDQEIVDVIQSHFTALQALITQLLAAVRPGDNARLVLQFMSLLSGSIIVAQITGTSVVARANRAQAKLLLAERPKTASRRTALARR